MTVPLVLRKCPNCGSSNAADEYVFDDHHIRKCVDCSFVYLPVYAPGQALADGELEWETIFNKRENAKSENAPQRRKLFLAYRRLRKNIFGKRDPSQFLVQNNLHPGEKKALLDIGCGNGFYLSSIPENYVPYGIEISTMMAQRCQELVAARGGKVVNADSVTGLAELNRDTFDAVIMRSYLEHEPFPREVLEGVSRVMKTGGMCVVKVPNYASWNRIVRGRKWCGFRYPEHVNYFTPASLGKMADMCGLRTIQSFLDVLPISDNMWAVLVKKQ